MCVLCIYLFGRIVYHQNHYKNVCKGFLGDWRVLVDHWHRVVKCSKASQEEDQGLLEVNRSPASEDRLGGCSREWNIDQLWFKCRNVLGRHGKVRGSIWHLRQLPRAKFLSQRRNRKRECAPKGRKGSLASKCTYFASSYSHSQGLLEGEEKKKGEVLFDFSTSQSRLNFGELGPSGEG